MPLQSGNALLQGIQRGLGVVNAARGNPLAEAQLAFQMRQHSDGQEYRDALTRDANTRADTAEFNLRQAQLADARTQFYELERDAVSEYGGLGAAFKDRSFQNRYVRAINAHPEAQQYLRGRELVRFEVFDANNPEELGALGWDANAIADFQARHGGGQDVMIPIVRNPDGSLEPLESSEFDDAVEAISEIDAWNIGRSLFTSSDTVMAPFDAMLGEGGDPLGGEFSMGGGAGGGRQPAPGLATIDPSMLGHLTVERESGGNPAAINGNEPGGTASYGPLQFNSAGALPAWFASDGAEFAPLFEGLQPGTDAFNRRWQEIASDPDMGQALLQSQHAYAERELFQPLAARAQGNGIDVRDPGVQEALFSTSIQHSPAGQTQILNTAMGYLGDNANPTGDEFLQAFYQARTDYLRNNTRLDDGMIANIEQHYATELQKARALSARGKEERRKQEMPISTSALAALTPDAIRSAQQVAGGPDHPANVVARLGAEAEASQQVPANGPAPVMDPADMALGRQLQEQQLGFESQEEFQEAKTAIARRLQEGRGIAPGVAKRAVDNEEVVDDVFRTSTPEMVNASGRAVLAGMEQSGERTYRSTSTTGRPTSEQRGHAFRLYATGLISREEMMRY